MQKTMQQNPVLHEVGALVKINNREHVWHNRLGVVKEVNTETGFHRVDLVSTQTWLPSHHLIAHTP